MFTPTISKRSRPLLAVAVVLVMALPLVSSASSLESTFLTSTSGTSTLAIGDTIQFEVTITLNAGQLYEIGFWSLTGDEAGATNLSFPTTPDWPGVDNEVIDWEWNYVTAGSSKVKMSTNGTIFPSFTGQSLPLPDRWSTPYGFLLTKTGNGIPAMVGTITILADASGAFSGGGFLIDGIGTFDGFGSSAGLDTVSVSTGSFTVVPEPGTATGLVSGAMFLAAMKRRKDRRGLRTS